MTASAPGSTPESRRAALSMFEGQVPCQFSLIDPSCPEAAAFLAWFAHEENTVACEAPPWPVCGDHKKKIQAVSHPFWRTWHQHPPVPCERCGTPLRLERFEPL